MIDIQELRTEVDTDPRVYGYPGFSNGPDLRSTLALLKLRRNTISVQVATFTVNELRRLFDQTEVAAMTADRWTGLSFFTSGGFSEEFPVDQVAVRNSIGNLLPANTRAAFIAAMTRDGSRTEELWGIGLVVTLAQLQQARDLP